MLFTVRKIAVSYFKMLEIIDSSMTAEAAAILDRQRYLPKSARTFLDVLQTVAARAAGGQHEER